MIIGLISDKLSHLLLNKQIPFIVGGSKECILAAAEAFF